MREDIGQNRRRSYPKEWKKEITPTLDKETNSSADISQHSIRLEKGKIETEQVKARKW